MFRTLENFYMKLGDETKREEKLEIIKTVYEKFENRLTQQFDCLEVRFYSRTLRHSRLDMN